ncbi:MAG: flagellar basal body protein, partial [Angelakisella sp.]
MRTKVITNNIANYETPGYKAKDVSFEQVLSDVNKSG